MSRVRQWCRKRCCCCKENSDVSEKNGVDASCTNPTAVELETETDNEDSQLPCSATTVDSPVKLGTGDLAVSVSITSPARENSFRMTQLGVLSKEQQTSLDEQRRGGSNVAQKRTSVDEEDRRRSLGVEKRYVLNAESGASRPKSLQAPVVVNLAEQKRISDAIDRELRKQKSTILNRSVVLLLGTGESGKSTFLKQLRIIHNRQFTDDELSAFRTTILNNAFFGVVTLLTAVDLFGASLSQQNAPHGERLKRVAAELQVTKQSCSVATFATCTDSLEAVWNDKSLQAVYARRSEFHVGENVRYFLRHVRRIGAAEYRPTDEDVLYARKPTKSVTELAIEINHRPFVFVDVGGQRVERSKWCCMFNDALTCILFLVASSEFDQMLVEDSSVNRLLESVNVFETVINHRSFADVSIVMFFNKADVLQEKVTLGAASKLGENFPKFTGDSRSLDDVKLFLVTYFQQRVRDATRPFYHHFTTAVDTNNIQLVFRSVKEILLEKNIDSIILH